MADDATEQTQEEIDAAKKKAGDEGGGEEQGETKKPEPEGD